MNTLLTVDRATSRPINAYPAILLPDNAFFCVRSECEASYTFRISSFGSALGGAGVLDKGFASMELA
ncbi:hypothetical protein [Methylotuvimicrobium sp. KM2]|uniref:hypothetical protein n=1 Tax=Methylotuvimicrobium sp. KM2 TaxID=3133976 RepID=UPI003101B1D7